MHDAPAQQVLVEAKAVAELLGLPWPPEKGLVDPELLDMSGVCRMLSVSRGTVWRLIADESAEFPQSIELPTGGTRWRRSELMEWIAQRPRTKGRRGK